MLAQKVVWPGFNFCGSINTVLQPRFPKPEYQNSMYSYGWPSPYIVLIHRGGCSFVQKVGMSALLSSQMDAWMDAWMEAWMDAWIGPTTSVFYEIILGLPVWMDRISYLSRSLPILTSFNDSCRHVLDKRYGTLKSRERRL
jgi:hypothetical protein